MALTDKERDLINELMEVEGLGYVLSINKKEVQDPEFHQLKDELLTALHKLETYLKMSLV